MPDPAPKPPTPPAPQSLEVTVKGTVSDGVVPVTIRAADAGVTVAALSMSVQTDAAGLLADTKVKLPAASWPVQVTVAGARRMSSVWLMAKAGETLDLGGQLFETSKHWPSQSGLNGGGGGGGNVDLSDYAKRSELAAYASKASLATYASKTDVDGVRQALSKLGEQHPLMVLAPADEVPAGTPAGTVVVRKAK